MPTYAPTSRISGVLISSARHEPGTAGAAAGPLVMALDRLDRAALPFAGGKAANLGELIAAGFPVPAGFCVTTAAYRAAAAAVDLSPLLATAADSTALAERARTALLGAPLPAALATAIREAYAAL